MDLDYADDVVLLSSILDTLVDALAILGEEASPLSLTNDEVYARAGTPSHNDHQKRQDAPAGQCGAPG